MTRGRLAPGWIGLLLAALAPRAVVAPAQSCSDGTNGPLTVSGSMTISLPRDGRLNYTSITVNAGSTLGFIRNAANTPAFLLATGPVLINGTIQLNAPNRSGGAGGGDGGLHGHGLFTGTGGTGPTPGSGGTSIDSRHGNAGGGGGMATAGTQAIRHSGPMPASGGAAIAFPIPMAGGSGGGGGAGWEFFGNLFDGGDGGGAGGGLVICSDVSITINGTITANGANGFASFANGGGNGGPGAGGSGGVIDLHSDSIVLSSTGACTALGGTGGGISTMPVFDPNYSSGANGGLGFLRVSGASVALAGTINALLICGDNCPDGTCGDLNADGRHDGNDVAGFVACLLTGSGCPCADTDCNHLVDLADVGWFVICLLG